MLEKNRFVTVMFFIVVLIATACSGAESPAESAESPPTVDTVAIADAVLAEVESQLSASTSVPAPTVDTGPIADAVMAEIESQWEQPTAVAVPTVDASAIADAVLAEVEAQRTLAANLSLEGSLIDVYQMVNPSVVYIIVPSGSGSGFVYDQDGHIVTNSHVIAGARDYEVVFANGERRRAQLVGADADSDLAVIQVDELPEGVQPLPLAQAADIQVGQFVVAIGNPFGEQGSMSLGIVSALGRSLLSQRERTSASTYSLPQVIQTDAPINPGNSGGPLLNLVGEVVGVNAAIATTSGTSSGVGFSIPVAAVRQVAPSLIADGAYTYPYMGVGFDDEVTLDEQSVYGLPQTQGAYVVSVTSGGPAALAGLIPASRSTGQGGDLVVQIDDQQINNFSDLNSYLVFHTSVGQTIQVTVLRNGELTVLPLTLGARP